MINLPFIPVFCVSAITRRPLPVALFDGDKAPLFADDDEDDDDEEDDDDGSCGFEGGLKVVEVGALGPRPAAFRPSTDLRLKWNSAFLHALDLPSLSTLLCSP